jgi:hypothetical protein
MFSPLRNADRYTNASANQKSRGLNKLMFNENLKNTNKQKCIAMGENKTSSKKSV